MSKKLSFILACVLALIAIVIVAVFGQLPEDLRPKIYMEKLEFVDARIELNSKGNKILYFDISSTNYTIDLDSMTKYSPNETTNISVRYLLDDDEIARVTPTGLLIFEEKHMIDFLKLEVTVESQDGSGLTDTLIIQNANLKGQFEDTREDEDFWS